MSDQSEALSLAKELRAYGNGFPDGPGMFRHAAVELRRQHSRIEADEALMREVLSTLISVGCIFRAVGDKSAMWDDIDASITALRARLETPK